MEQFETLSSSITKALPLSTEQTKKLVLYALSIHKENQRFNLTGHKSPEEIISNLIIKSIAPVTKLNVPRGTFFADLGTGAGIPGIPLAVFIKESKGILFDSNHKKINFINTASRECDISNIKGVSCRIEEEGKKDLYRETFDWVFSRAMADVYIACELGAPLLKKDGYLFLYSRDVAFAKNPHVGKHISSLGLELIKNVNNREKDYNGEGLLFKKQQECPALFPRRMTAIKRDRKKIAE